jgi:transposase
LSDAGFDYSVLSKFRTRLVEGQAEQLLFEQVLAILQQRGLVKAGGNNAPILPTFWRRRAP